MRTRSRVLPPPRALCALVALLIGVFVVDVGRAPTEAPAAASPWVLDAEQQLFDLHNQHRVANGMAPFVRDPALDGVAREWTAHMAATMGPSNDLGHRPDMVEAIEAAVTTQWQSIGENVGWTSSNAAWLHQAFLDSPGHRANIEGNYNRVGIGAAYDVDGHLYMTVNFLRGPAIMPDAAPTGTADAWFVSSGGVVASLGDAPHRGDMAGVALNQPVVGMAATKSGSGYWMVASDGGIFTFGDAGFHGSTGAMALNAPIVAMAATPSGKGYWLVASDGGIFTFGDAGFYGSTGHIALAAPIVGMAPSPTGKGYWLLASDGGIFSFGDAVFHGSTGDMALNAPIVGMAPSSSGGGYWLVAADGGVFAFGDAGFVGSAAGQSAVGILADDDGTGYWIFTSGGGILAYGSAGSGVVGQAAAGADIAAIVALG